MDLLLILIVVLIILLIWRGPTMLPQLGEALGKTVKGIRESVDRDAPRPPEGTDAEAAWPPAEAARPPAEAVSPPGETPPPAEGNTAARHDGGDPDRAPGP